jgi:preprotein translocase SecE subunit
LVGSTIIVIAMSIVMAAFIGVVDKVLSGLINILMRLA